MFSALLSIFRGFIRLRVLMLTPWEVKKFAPIYNQ